MYGMCHHRSSSLVVEREVAPAAAERSSDERVTDSDRQRTADLLSTAFRDGVIRVEELDQRLSATYAAATVGDLEAVIDDLPQEWRRRLQDARAHEERSTRRRARWAAEVRTYVKVMAVLVTIWLLTSIGDGEAGMNYFWPLWPMLGWGIPLFLGRPRGPVARAVRRRRLASTA